MKTKILRTGSIITAIALLLVVVTAVVLAGGREERAVTLNVFTLTGPFISGPIERHAAEWEEKWEGKYEINVIQGAFPDLFSQVQSVAATGSDRFDMLLVGNAWMADFVGWDYIIPLSRYVENLDWYPDDVVDGVVAKNTFKGETYGLICDNDNMFLFYRTDILGNEEYQARFRDEYGYSYNTPPQTLKELIDVAEFFNGWDWSGDGQDNVGFVTVTRRGNPQFMYSYPWVAPFSVIPHDEIDTAGVMFFEPETMRPLANSPGWVKGLELYHEMIERGTGPGLDWTRGDVINEIILGHAAMAIDHGDIGPESLSDASRVQGKLGFAMSPGSNEYWDWRTNEWVETEEVHYAPAHSFNGWSWYITSTTEHPDIAFDFIEFMLSERISSIDVAVPDSGYQPWSRSHADNVGPWLDHGWDRQSAESYIQAVLDSTEHPNAVVDLRIPGSAEYSETIYDVSLSSIITGSQSAQEALDEVATQWDALTDRLGRDEQIEFYHHHLGIDD